MATPIRDRFVKNNGCTTQERTRQPGDRRAAQPPPYLNPGGHICTDYAGCSAGHPLRWCVRQSGHGPGPIDGTSDLYNSCATPPKTCSASCPCTWTPDDVWPWLTGQTSNGQTPNATSMLNSATSPLSCACLGGGIRPAANRGRPSIRVPTSGPKDRSAGLIEARWGKLRPVLDTHRSSPLASRGIRLPPLDVADRRCAGRSS